MVSDTMYSFRSRVSAYYFGSAGVTLLPFNYPLHCIWRYYPLLPSALYLRYSEDSTGRVYALKRMRKSAVVQCPEHVYCEQAITKNVAHPFCIRQYASFQVSVHPTERISPGQCDHH